MHYAILDTNVYIGHWEKGWFASDLEQLERACIVRHSSVVLSELRRGARTAAARRRVAALVRALAVEWAPTAGDWWLAGKLIREIGDACGWEVAKRRDFQNDALIALTARRHGAAVVTANAADFALLAKKLHIDVVPVYP